MDDVKKIDLSGFRWPLFSLSSLCMQSEESEQYETMKANKGDTILVTRKCTTIAMQHNLLLDPFIIYCVTCSRLQTN